MNLPDKLPGGMGYMFIIPISPQSSSKTTILINALTFGPLSKKSEESGWGCVNVFRNARSIMFSYDVAYSVQTAGR